MSAPTLQPTEPSEEAVEGLRKAAQSLVDAAFRCTSLEEVNPGDPIVGEDYLVDLEMALAALTHASPEEEDGPPTEDEGGES